MAVNWARVYNRLFELINEPGSMYYSGGRFIIAIRQVDPYFPDYTQYIDQRRSQGKSTSRKDYYYDILLSLPEESRACVVNGILDHISEHAPEKVSCIRDELGGVAAVPVARLDSTSWNAERLNRYLNDIDGRIAAGNFSGAITLSYTCLEGFLRAFMVGNLAGDEKCNEIIEASKAVRNYLRATIERYPDEAIAMLTHIAHTVDRARNRFSESHFDEEADRWMAVFVRDLVNSEIRLLLHFMGSSSEQ